MDRGNRSVRGGSQVKVLHDCHTRRFLRAAGNNCQSGFASAWLTGWAAGVGAEWAFLNDWTERIEYLHYDLGRLSHPMIDPAFVFVFNAEAGFEGDIVRVGVNRLFR